MLSLFDSVKSALIKLEEVTTDNNVFRLHYKATFNILIICTILVTSRQYIGDPIDCIVEGIDPGIMDTYCWVHSTYTIPEAARKGAAVAHPGVKQPDGENAIYHTYYQWVVFMLFLQSVMFYVPRYMWKSMEKGRIKHLVMGLTTPIVPAEVKKNRLDALTNYFHSNYGEHNFYAYKFVLCEVLNFVNVVAQIYITDAFLGGHFTTYGPDVFSFNRNETDLDPMAKVFPITTKCTFHRFGQSGTIQRIDGLCVLPVNIINEKIYIFLWVWFVLVAVVSGALLVYRIFTLLLPPVRYYSVKAFSPLADGNDLNDIVKRCQFGDWFVLSRLAKNMDSHIFREFIGESSNKLRGKKV